MELDIRQVTEILVNAPGGLTLYQVGYQPRDGSSPFVTRNFAGISEKIEPGESPLDAAVRGVDEEIGLTVAASRLVALGTRTEVKPSPSTGQLTQYEFKVFALELSPGEVSQVPLTIEETKGTLFLEWKKSKLKIGRRG